MPEISDSVPNFESKEEECSKKGTGVKANLVWQHEERKETVAGIDTKT